MRVLGLAVAAALSVMAGGAQAASYVVQQTIDLDLIGPYDLGNAITLAEGDALDLTVDFAGGPFRYTFDIAYLGLASSGGQPTGNAHMTGFLQLLGKNGFVTHQVAVNDFVTQGQAAFVGAVGGFPYDARTYGVRVVGELTDYEPVGLTSRTYDRLSFWYSGAAIPEPSTWALLIAGFGLAGAGLRRRALPA